MSTYRRLPSLLIGGVCFAIVAYGLAAAQEQSTEPSDAVQSPSEDDLMRSRYAAAIADREQEQERVNRANERYADEQLTGAVPRHYIASFANPVSSSLVLEGIAEDPAIILQRTFVWLPPTGTAHPLTGTHEVDSATWDPQQEATAISNDARGFLQSRADALRALLLKALADPNATAAFKQQLDEVQGLLLSLNKPDLYGIECICSPNSLDRLASEVPPIQLRAVELTEDVQYPVWTQDPLRARVIETGGSFGI